jgi:hypothetical protein|tara:strand:+ start:878 stop:1132 length:255 start_codon:yes stop_codon:yes gene_type:complete
MDAQYNVWVAALAAQESLDVFIRFEDIPRWDLEGQVAGLRRMQAEEADSEVVGYIEEQIVDLLGDLAWSFPASHGADARLAREG